MLEQHRSRRGFSDLPIIQSSLYLQKNQAINCLDSTQTIGSLHSTSPQFLYTYMYSANSVAHPSNQ